MQNRKPLRYWQEAVYCATEGLEIASGKSKLTSDMSRMKLS